MKRNSGAIEEKLSLLYNAECLFAAANEDDPDFDLINPHRNFSIKIKRVPNPSNTTYIVSNKELHVLAGNSCYHILVLQNNLSSNVTRKNND